MTKPKSTKTEAPQTLNVCQASGEPPGRAIARTVLQPSLHAGLTAQKWRNRRLPASDLNDLVAELASQASAANNGSMVRSEAMLVAQSHTLDAIFNSLAQIARANLVENLDAADKLLRLGLKAQSQCRATIEALATIKNPPNVAFVNQANIASNQQVNNGSIPVQESETERLLNELLGRSHGERLDPRAAGAASGTDSKLETVAAIHGTANDQR